MRELRVRLSEDFTTGSFDLYIAQVDTMSDQAWIARPDEFGNLVFSPLPKYGIMSPPTLRFGRLMGSNILKALQGEFEKAGFRTEAAVRNEGIIEAMRYHLEDLRRLLKLKR